MTVLQMQKIPRTALRGIFCIFSHSLYTNQKISAIIIISLVSDTGVLIFLLNSAEDTDMKKAYRYFTSAVSVIALLAGVLMYSDRNELNVKADTSVKISPDNTYKVNDGEFEGWGTSLCWWANRVGYSDELSKKAAETFFSDKGLNLNIVRYNIGGGDDPTHDHITRTDSNMPGYTVYNNGQVTYNWNADRNQQNVLMKIKEAYGDDLIVEMFSNSPPYYMCKSGCSTGNTSAGSNNLKDDCYDDFADYLANVCYYFKNELGIKVQSVEPVNEPYTDYWGAYSKKQEGCHFDIGSSESTMITELSRAMKNKGMSDVIISGTDETGIDVQISAINSMSDDAKNVLGRIDTHSYGGSKRAELQEAALTNGKNLWMSEVDGSGTAGSNAGDMANALWFSKRIIDDCNGLGCSAWIMWQVMDNHISSQGYNGKKDSGMPNLSGGFWGLAVADHDRKDIILSQKYYAFGQFTKYIRPGFTMLNSSSNTLAAYDKENDQLVIVAVNTQGSSQNYNFDLSGFKTVGNSVKVVRTSGSNNGGEHWAELDPLYVNSKSFNASLKANSVTTFIIENVTENDTPVDGMNEIKLDSSMLSGSDPWKNSSNGIEKIVDGKASTFFDGVTDGWVQIDLGKSYSVDAIAYAPRPGYEYRMTEGIIAGSEDGVNWQKIYTVPSKPNFGFSYITDIGKNFRYIKYYVPEGSPSNSDNKEANFCCNISEIKLYGKEAGNTVLKGDINTDGSVNAADVSGFVSYLLGIRDLNEEQLKLADIDDDQKVNIADLIRLKSLIIN